MSGDHSAGAVVVIMGGLAVVVFLGDEFAGVVVVVALGTSIEADLFDQAVEGVVAKTAVGAVLVGQLDQPAWSYS
ncbi:hypothetical protein [Halopseudomonas salegens]|uniref:hypothetical protein n=1 Tax=Halopseudomonas salegens TaxID=1434072 RepID=UPI001E3CFA9D|nr:hypothetical protein [Halopseudomonas salegens]